VTEPGERFERGKRQVGLVAGPLIAAAIALLGEGGLHLVHGVVDGVPRGSAPPVLPALMALCVIWWITEAVPAAVVAIVAVVGAVLTGLASPRAAFAVFGTPLLFLFYGSFFLAEAMKSHGLGERLARAITALAGSRRGLLVAVAFTAFVLSMLMSNSASTAILLPIVLPIAVASGDARFGTALVLMVAWASSVGGIGTPVGTPPNLIGIAAMRELGHDLSFVGWMSVGVPLGVVMLGGLLLVLMGLLRVKNAPIPRGAVVAHAWSPGERSVTVAVGIAVVGWMLPTALDLVAPGSLAAWWVNEHLREEVVALIAGCSLFVLPGGRPEAPWARPALLWREAARIDWGVIFLFAGGVLLGDLAGKNGLSDEWGRALVAATGASTTWTITALCTAIAIVLSELTSNTATAVLMAPLAGNLAVAAGAAPIPAMLGATIGSSFGFMLPISTAPNAMAYGTGRVRMGQMIRTGIVFDVVGFVVIVGGLRVLCPLLGLD
jgi:solute carrier family 13 (sodium-dependent dicarboxylate transporter), member 2/3/5